MQQSPLRCNGLRGHAALEQHRRADAGGPLREGGGVGATRLPVNADFETGYAADATGVARNVRLAVDTGVAGLSIEDSTGDPQAPLRDMADAVERMRAARSAIDAAGGDTLLVGRAENVIVGRPDLDDAIRRLKAYAEAGADCLYAPGIKTREQIVAVVAAVAPKPVNLLVGAPLSLTVQDIEALGVRRISVGGALARRLGRVHARCTGDRRQGPVRRLRTRGERRGTERPVQGGQARRHQDLKCQK